MISGAANFLNIYVMNSYILQANSFLVLNRVFLSDQRSTI